MTCSLYFYLPNIHDLIHCLQVLSWNCAGHLIEASRSLSSGASSPLEAKETSKFSRSKRIQTPSKYHRFECFFHIIHLSNFYKIFISLGLGHVLAKVNIHSLSLCPGWLPCLLFAAIPSLSSLSTFPHFLPFWTALFCLLFPLFVAPFHPLFGPSFGLYF